MPRAWPNFAQSEFKKQKHLNLFLVGELRLADVLTPKLDVQGSLDLAEDGLVEGFVFRRALQVCDV